MTFSSQARRTCGTTHFIRPCTILHATGFGLPPNFEDWISNLVCTTCFWITFINIWSHYYTLKSMEICLLLYNRYYGVKMWKMYNSLIFLTLQLSTRSLSQIISTDLGNCPAGAFSGISYRK